MPFDFREYDAKCATLDGDALQLEWEHYTRLISGAATSTAVSGVAFPFTLGVSGIGVAMAAPAIHNARKKREIIERHLQRHGRLHRTRKRDVLTAGAISGTVGVVTLGVAPIGADMVTNSAAEHGVNYLVENELLVKAGTHFALDAVAVGAEETHMHSKKDKEAWKAYARALKEGRNPPLPPSHPHATAQMVASVQAVNVETVPSINVLSPSEQKITVQQAVTYPTFTPGQAGLQVGQQVQRRNSTPNLQASTQQNLPISPQSMYYDHTMLATATAISAPLTGGQSYHVQVPGTQHDLPAPPIPARPESSNSVQAAQERPYLPCRPHSELEVHKSTNGPVQFETSVAVVQLGTPPAVPPRPSNEALTEISEVQLLHPQTQPQMQRPRGQSVGFLDNHSNPAMRVPPPPPPPVNTTHRFSVPNAYTPNYASAQASSHRHSTSFQSPQSASMTPISPPSWPPKYNPMDYAQPQY